MQRYLHFLEHKASKDLIRAHPDFSGHRGYGDWLALDGGGKTEGLTPKDLIGTAFLAYDASLMAKIARVLERETDARKYEDLQTRVTDAFQRRYLTPSGQVVSGTQTAYVLALRFDLVPAELIPKAAEELVRNIRERNFHIATGFVGTPYILDVLEMTGHLDVAYRLLEQESFPS